MENSVENVNKSLFLRTFSPAQVSKNRFFHNFLVFFDTECLIFKTSEEGDLHIAETRRKRCPPCSFFQKSALFHAANPVW